MGCRFAVRVTPRGGRDAVEGVDDRGVLRVRVSAAPTDGGANRAVVRLLAEALGVPPSAVAIVGGDTGRVKRVTAAGLPAATIRACWPGIEVR
jgi:uncharacterized protein (TIGR00251 family)